MSDIAEIIFNFGTHLGSMPRLTQLSNLIISMATFGRLRSQDNRRLVFHTENGWFSSFQIVSTAPDGWFSIWFVLQAAEWFSRLQIIDCSGLVLLDKDGWFFWPKMIQLVGLVLPADCGIFIPGYWYTVLTWFSAPPERKGRMV
jgi:hypothetical protein